MASFVIFMFFFLTEDHIIFSLSKMCSYRGRASLNILESASKQPSDQLRYVIRCDHVTGGFVVIIKINSSTPALLHFVKKRS